MKHISKVGQTKRFVSVTVCEDLLIFLELCLGYLFKLQLQKLNFYFNQVIWYILYYPSSAMDTETLFQGRNFLNAKTAPASPMKDINACEHLLMKNSEALTIAAFHRFTAVLNIPIKDTKDEEKSKELIETILNAFVDEYVLPEVCELLSLL